MTVPVTASSSATPTFTPIDLLRLPNKNELCAAFVGKSLSTVRTPAIVVDRTCFKTNCETMNAACVEQGISFRTHVKTHKTVEGVRMQLEAGTGCHAVVCSTMMECWQIVREGLVREGLVKDMLYGLPCGIDKLQDLSLLAEEMARYGAVLRLMIDNPGQIMALARNRLSTGPWSIFIKVDGGGRRAGLPPKSADMRELISVALASDDVEIFGFYSHFGQSYSSSCPDEAALFLEGEVSCVAYAAKVAIELGAAPTRPYVLSVGATPTAHAVDSLHAVNLPGQIATKMVTLERVATSVLTHVISLYPHRQEAMCDAAAIAMARDAGPIPGFGRVVYPTNAVGWGLGRMSQEHGTLVQAEGETGRCARDLELGEMLRIVGQHACVTLAAHPWFYCVDDGGDIITDVWVPWKGW
ncbi:hypothetical protein EHS25_007225 [Saitozyma podzolica]|uniref:D-serine dehydratase n=1 Tax=Saitozyma podzolica TaxID=1890683 RepID=A0A427XMU8_9TREE|nr:hypothetical protein EHS25_007225 [Saitozyma podzolica]